MAIAISSIARADVGRDAFRVPENQITADMALGRIFVLHEHLTLDARFEVFNLFN
ncbi:MAG TPA: hypothetical protein VK604_12680 [Bryobacteraceae bacterium]|nr:hypothetical protein [Bryobacteraceae bacterium]